MNTKDKNTVAHFSEVEVQDLLNNLTETDKARLLQIYRTLGCSSRSGLLEHDVLSLAVVKVLSLERRWPKDVNTMSFFINTGRSIISNEEEKYSKLITPATTDEFLTVNDESLTPESSTVNLSHASVETQIEQSQSDNSISTWISKIQKLFEDDPEADCFIKQKLNEQKKSRILVLCEFTDQVYRNVKKRIKDKVGKRFPNGLPWWEIES